MVRTEILDQEDLKEFKAFKELLVCLGQRVIQETPEVRGE